MRISLNWLNDYIPISQLPAQKIADTLTSLGIEVECIESFSTLSGEVVVGKILSASPHPNADNLKVCQVDVGESESLEIVCGASNARDGLVTAVAKIGSELPGNFKIKKSKIRGVTSFGMLAAGDELGISSDHEGIVELHPSTKLGSDVAELFQLKDTILTLSITPNRSDCFGYVGVARELSAKLELPLTLPDTQNLKTTADVDTANYIQLDIQNSVDCPRFSGLYMEGISICPSPNQIQLRLSASGMRPINNVVDATNYAMLEFGQPIHAYDLREIHGGLLGVGRAKSGEAFVTLDGQTRLLQEDDLVIFDGNGTIGLAGVMGGQNSEIKEDTASVCIEVACFDPISIRKTSKRLGMHTEASHRFERGIDMTILTDVARRVAHLVQLSVEALPESNRPALPKVAARGVDFYPSEKKPSKIALRIPRVRQILGMSVLEKEKIVSSLEALGFSLLDQTDERLLFETPLWRNDMEREIDLIEEVGRLIGYDEIPYALPLMEIAGLKENPFIEFIENCKTSFAQQRFLETICLPFVSTTDLLQWKIPETGHPYASTVALANPIADDGTHMQPSALLNLVKALDHNHRHGEKGLRLFEVSRGYFVPETNPLIREGTFPYLSHLLEPALHLSSKASSEHRSVEKNLLGFVLDQPLASKSWMHNEASWVDFFPAKKILSPFLYNLIKDDSQWRWPAIDPKELPFLHPAKSAYIEVQGKIIGFLGALHPEVAKAYHLSSETPPFIGEIALERLFSACQTPNVYQTEFSKFPPAERDIALVLDQQITHQKVRDVIEKFPRKKYLSGFHLFDLYQGEGIAPGRKSMAYSFSFRSVKKTLQDKEVDKEMENLVSWLIEQIPAQLR